MHSSFVIESVTRDLHVNESYSDGTVAYLSNGTLFLFDGFFRRLSVLKGHELYLP